MSAAAKSGHPTSAMSAADLLAVLVDGYLRYDFSRAEEPRERPARLLEGPRVDAPVRDLPRRRRRLRRGDPRLPQAREHARGPPDARSSRGSTSRPARSARACRSASGMALAGEVPRAAAEPRLGALRRQRDGRGLDVGGLRARRALRARQPHGDHRREPARPARRDDGRLGSRRRTSRAPRRSAGTRSRSTATTSRRSTTRSPRPSRRPGQPTVVVARTMKGKGVAAVENQNGFHGKPLDDPDAAIAELGGLRGHPHRGREARAGARPQRARRRRARASALRARHRGRDAQGVRRRARGARRRAAGRRRRSTARSRTRRSPRSSRRRIPSGTSRCTSPSSRWSPPRSGSRRSAGGRSPRRSRRSSRAPTTSCAWRRSAARRSRSAARTPASRSARTARRRWRSRTSRRSARSTAAPCSIRATRTRRRSSSRRWPRPTGSRTCARCGRRRRSSTRPTRSSRSAAAASCARATSDEVALIGAGITVHEALKAADALAEEGIAARVIDLYSIKPLDAETLAAAAEATERPARDRRGPLARGRSRRRVLAALADTDEPPRVVKLAVREMPRSGKPEELLAAAGIDAEHIAAAARKLVAQTVRTGLDPLAAPSTLRRPWPSSSHRSCARSSRAIRCSTNVSFTVGRKDRLSLAGANGAGKTTLLRAIAGETSLQGGKLAFAKGTRVALHDQRPPLEFDITLREYALSGARDLLEVEDELRRLEQAMAGRRARRRDAAPLRGGAGPARARRRLGLARPRRRGGARPRLRRRRPRPAARHVLRRGADARVARARARRQPGSPPPRRADEPPRRRRTSSGSSASSRRSTRRSSSSRTTAGSSRRSRPPCSSSRPAARTTSRGRGTSGARRRRRAPPRPERRRIASPSTSRGSSASSSGSATRSRRRSRRRRS